MCGGGRPARATVMEPDTAAYDRMLAQQIAAMQQVQNSGVMAAQQQLNSLLAQEQGLLGQVRDIQVQRANSTAEDARRIAALMGPPPPEKGAMAPVIGADRAGRSRPAGKRGLRIQPGAGAEPGYGAGLQV